MIVHRSTTRVMAPPTETTPLAHKNEIAHTPLGHTETTPDTHTANYWRPAEEPISALAQEKTSRDTSDTGFQMIVLAKLHYTCTCTVARRHARCLQNGASYEDISKPYSTCTTTNINNQCLAAVSSKIDNLYSLSMRTTPTGNRLMLKHKKKLCALLLIPHNRLFIAVRKISARGKLH